MSYSSHIARTRVDAPIPTTKLDGLNAEFQQGATKVKIT